MEGIGSQEIVVTTVDSGIDVICRGLFYRCRKSYYRSNVNFTFREEYRFLCKMSCTGCDRCMHLLDAMKEQDNEFPADGINGEIYRLAMIDPETGCWDIGFEHVDSSGEAKVT